MSAERATVGQMTERTTRRLLTWQGSTPPSIESVRLQADDRLRAKARLAVAGVDPFHAGFELVVDETGAVSRLLISVTTRDEDSQLSVQRSEDGYWYVDDGTGAVRTAFDGALDVSVAHAVLFHTLPVRRHELHRRPGEIEIPVVHIDLPDSRPRVVRQTYRTVSISDRFAVIRHHSEGRTTDITVDDQAVVLDHPAVATRL